MILDMLAARHKRGNMLAPRFVPKLKSFSRSHVHAQTVKNRSSCNSRASRPKEDNIE